MPLVGLGNAKKVGLSKISFIPTGLQIAAFIAKEILIIEQL